MGHSFVTPLSSSLFFFLLCCALSLPQAASNNITQGQSIIDGQTLISPDEVFALGFFSPPNSTNRFLGIWYNTIDPITVVWVANRNSSISDKSGNLTVAPTGKLELTKGTGLVVWSSNYSASTPTNSTLVLDNSGNLALHQSSGRRLWQSFDHPTDTFLPGMTVELDLRTGTNELFTSWRSANDPGPGKYTMGLDPMGTAQVMIWEGESKRWRSGQWNAQSFTGVLEMRPLNLYGFKLANDSKAGKMQMTYTPVDQSTLIRFVIRWDGKVEQLVWNESNKNWTLQWTQPTSVCELYGRCGPFGICSAEACRCIKGYDARPGADGRRGCVRRKEWGCARNESGFVKLERMKLPDQSNWAVTGTAGREECEAKCLSNCSCTAYAFGRGFGCLIWRVDLMDIREFQGGGNEIYIRLHPSELGGKSKISKAIIIVIVVVVAIFSGTLAYLLWRLKRKGKGHGKKKEIPKIPMFDLPPSKELSAEFSSSYDLGEADQKSLELPYFNFSCIAYATNNFSDENKLGQGGFGPVYKGRLPGGQEIAVKRLSKSSGQGLEEFTNEVRLIAKLQHRNLVRILGCCVQGDERSLIYEYMPNKSLDVFVFDSTKRLLLDWRRRFNIIEAIARGLLYLHRDSRLRIIHRDLKASNILLDEEMSPKISDFGMARIFGGNQNHANTNRVVGTYGYMSPEYAMEGLFSVKSDVYSFGVLLLEIVSGKKNSSTFQHDDDNLNLVGHAWKLWNEDRATELVDSSLRESYSVREALRCIHVGLLCVQDHASDRPTMSSVVSMLESEIRTHANPRPPTFSVGHSRETEPLHSSERYSTNDGTITMVIGR